MSILRHSQSVSLAHRYWNNLWSHKRNREVYGAHASVEGIGNNLRVELEVESEGDFDFRPAARQIKALLDHRSLFDEVAEFSTRPSTLEHVTSYVADEIFKFPAGPQARWSAVTLWELDRFACRVQPGRMGVDFKLAYRNLLLTFAARVDLQSGLALDRTDAIRILDKIFSQFSLVKYEQEFMSESVWLSGLFTSIQAQIPNLYELQVDLGSHKLMKVDDRSTSPR